MVPPSPASNDKEWIRMKFYLAHPLKIRHEIRERELEFEKNTGIELINPFYDPKGKDEELDDTA